MKGNKMSKVNHVIKTYDYSLFRHISGNRNINKANLDRIKKSMSEHYLPIPIVVNENMEIIDGQHRFEAAKSLDLPVYYIKIEGLTLDEVRVLNTYGANWNNTDRLYSYCQLGFKEYIKFKDFMEQTGFSYGACIALLSGSPQRSGEHGRKFKDGQFKVKNYEKALYNAKLLNQIGEYYPNLKKSNLLGCMIELFHHADYNHNRMIQKLKVQAHMLPKTGSKETYKANIRDIYNYKVPTSQKVGFF